MSEQEFRQLSKAMDAGLVAYDFGPTEVLLLLILKGETFDRNQVEGKIDLVKWGRLLKWRADKLEKEHWKELCKLGVVDANVGQGTYRLRPDPVTWSRDRGLRVPENDLRAGQELDLTADRPLSDAMSELSLETALQKGAVVLSGTGGTPGPTGSQASPTVEVDWKRLREAITRGTVEEDFPEYFSGTPPADFSAAVAKPAGLLPAEKSATLKTPEKPAPEGAAEKSASVPLASYGNLTPKSKLAKDPAEKSAAAYRWLLPYDRHGTLKGGNHNARRFAKEWEELCNREPEFILGRLASVIKREDLRERIRKDANWDPLAYLAGLARKEGKFIRRGKNA